MSGAAGLKRRAAERAVAEIRDGMVVGLGTGSTAAAAIEILGGRVREGLNVTGIPTSERSADLAMRAGIPLGSFATRGAIDLDFDGADQVERGTLNLVKGMGGALLREKIVAAASRRVIIIVDESKLVDRLGLSGPVPVEVASFGWEVTESRLRRAGSEPKLRMKEDGRPFATDGGNYILDCRFGAIADPAGLERELAGIVGVVESGLFIGLATEVIVAGAAGIEILRPAS